MPHYSAIIASPIGKLGILTAGDGLTGIDFLSPKKEGVSVQDAFTKEVVKQLQTYFRDSDFSFDLPMQLTVTAFQERVLKALVAIPTCETRSYGELAQQLKSGARAIGMACRRNPIPIVIPCHRVIAKQGIGGYSGVTQGTKMDIKRWLLMHEGCQKTVDC